MDITVFCMVWFSCIPACDSGISAGGLASVCLGCGYHCVLYGLVFVYTNL